MTITLQQAINLQQEQQQHQQQQQGPSSNSNSSTGQLLVCLGKLNECSIQRHFLLISSSFFCSTQGGGNQNSGWFGGLWNKFTLKPKNQMILPDDKNPTIVWDKERKCWTNTEGNAEETESFKPPPKMSDMGSVAAAAAAAASSAVPPPALIPTPLATPLQQQQQPQQQQHDLSQANIYDNNQSTAEYDYNNYAEQVQQQQQQYAPVPAPSPAPATATPAAAQAAATPTAGAAGGAQPKLQSNMFKIKRNRSKCNKRTQPRLLCRLLIYAHL